MGLLLWVIQKKIINGHFFSFLSFCHFFSFSFDTLNQYCYILCLIHQCECINVSVIIMYIPTDMYNIITDTLIHSCYCILVNSKLVFCHFLFSSKCKNQFVFYILLRLSYKFSCIFWNFTTVTLINSTSVNFSGNLGLLIRITELI